MSSSLSHQPTQFVIIAHHIFFKFSTHPHLFLPTPYSNLDKNFWTDYGGGSNNISFHYYSLRLYDYYFYIYCICVWVYVKLPQQNYPHTHTLLHSLVYIALLLLLLLLLSLFHDWLNIAQLEKYFLKLNNFFCCIILCTG